MDFLIYVNVFLLGLTILLFGVILIIKTSKGVRHFYQKRFIDRISKDFQQYLISLSENEGERLTSVQKFQLSQFKSSLIGDSTKDLFLQHLTRLTRDLQGEFTEALSSLYIKLELADRSLRKMKYGSTDKKIHGIQEIGEFRYQPALAHVLKWTTNANGPLREEAKIAIINLSTVNPLIYLEKTTHELSGWLQLRLHHTLKQSTFQHNFSFDQWINHSIGSVRSFMIHLIILFKRIDLIPSVRGKIDDPDSNVRFAVYQAISELGDDQDCEQVLDRLNTENDPKVLGMAIRALAAIALPTHLDSILPLLNSTDSNIKFSTVKTIHAIADAPTAVIQKFYNQEIPEDIRRMERHVLANL